MKPFRQGKIYAVRFAMELEKEVRALEKKDPFNGTIFRKITENLKHTVEGDWEFALFDFFETFQYYAFLSITPETMEWANRAIACADEWPPPPHTYRRF